MIYFFNECDAPQWRLDEVAENRYRLTLIANEKFGIPINLSNAKINKKNLLNCNDNRDMSVIADCNTTMRFNTKTLQPSIIESNNSFNSDVYIISFNLEEGYELINQMRRNAYIYFQYYDAANCQLHMILSLNVREERIYVEDILLNEKAGMVQMKHLMFTHKYKKASVIMRESSIEKVKTTKRGERGFIDMTDKRHDGIIRLPIYIPMRPTKLVVVDSEEDAKKVRDIFKDVFNINSSSPTVIVLDSDEKRKEIKNYAVNKEYSAITYFNSECGHDDLKGKLKDISFDIKNKKFGKYFKYTLLMTKEGRVHRIR